jgi:hypothetical protein
MGDLSTMIRMVAKSVFRRLSGADGVEKVSEGAEEDPLVAPYVRLPPHPALEEVYALASAFVVYWLALVSSIFYRIYGAKIGDSVVIPATVYVVNVFRKIPVSHLKYYSVGKVYSPVYANSTVTIAGTNGSSTTTEVGFIHAAASLGYPSQITSIWAVVKDRFQVFLGKHINLGRVSVDVMRQMSTVLTVHPLRLGARGA